MEINISNVKYKYDKDNVLNGINMSIEDGKITGILGKSGSGKTTLLEMFNALRIPTEGIIKIDQFNIEKGSRIDLNKLRFIVGLVSSFPEDMFFYKTVKNCCKIL